MHRRAFVHHFRARPEQAVLALLAFSTARRTSDFLRILENTMSNSQPDERVDASPESTGRARGGRDHVEKGSMTTLRSLRPHLSENGLRADTEGTDVADNMRLIGEAG